MLKKRRRLTVRSMARALSSVADKLYVQQIRGSTYWFLDGNEPFAEITIDMSTATVRLSAHCPPSWAAIAAAVLVEAGATRLYVNTEAFIQTDTGTVLTGPTAEAYARTFHNILQLNALRTNPYDPN